MRFEYRYLVFGNTATSNAQTPLDCHVNCGFVRLKISHSCLSVGIIPITYLMKPSRPAVVMAPSVAWILVFVPALIYFLSTRLPSLGFWNELGEPVSVDLWIPSQKNASMDDACSKLSESLYLATSSSCLDHQSSESVSSVPLRYPLQLVHATGLKDVVDIIWRHDSELGRGYLLISESSGHGRIWRWEVGGGPIAIGRTLHLDDSGCRSPHCVEQYLTSGTEQVSSAEPNGSGAMALDFHRAGNPSDHSSGEGLLVVAEWGEGRIVRLEANGARTPLIMHIPCIDHCQRTDEASSSPCSQRIPNSRRMVFTPTGDLIVAVNFESAVGECRTNGASSLDMDPSVVQEDTPPKMSTAALIVLSGAVHVEPLSSLQASREAHGWSAIQNHNHSIHALVSDPSIAWIGGIAIASPTKLYGCAKVLQATDESFRVVIFEIPMGDEDDDNDDEDDDDTGSNSAKDMTERGTLKILFDITEHGPTFQETGAIAVGKSGRIYVSVVDGVLILDITAGGVIGKIRLPNAESPSALTLGGDRYLYVASGSSLYRIRTKDEPIALPTNRVTKRSTSKNTKMAKG